MNRLDVFRVPAYTFYFEDHSKFVDEWKLYNDNYKYYTSSNNNSVKLSLPNFHKSGVWAPLTSFFEKCLSEVLVDLKFDFEIGITSMWSTIQGRGGYHHMHTHKNCMFVGTYYLYSDVDYPNGTTFHNSMSDFSPFKTSGFYGGKGDKSLKDMESTSWFDGAHHVPFEAGKLVIYPGWMRHSGIPHKGENRQIVAFNAMPIGKLDKDPLQRYHYADFRDMKHPYDDM
jgi:uncharacterized protein (TIGR02466 family)